MEILKNYINGSWTESKEQQTTNVVNPANQEVLAKVPFGDKTAIDVDSAVAAAAEAFKRVACKPGNAKGSTTFQTEIFAGRKH